ncbi:MAG: GAF domain-containing protein [Anaerolineales bacterium]
MRDEAAREAHQRDELAALRRENVLLHARLEQQAAEAERQAETLQRRNQELAFLNRAGRKFNSSLDLAQVLSAVLEEVRELLGVVACSAWLLDQDAVVCKEATGPQRDAVCGWRLPQGVGLAGWVIAAGESLIVQDVWQDERFYPRVEKQVDLGLHALLAVPLRVKGTTTGVIQVLSTEPNHFTESDLELMEALAASAATAVENARLYTEHRALERALEQSEGYYRTLFQTTGTAMMIIEEDTTISLVNQEFANLSGYPRGEIEGRRSWTEFVDGQDLRRMQTYHHLRRTDPGAAPKHYEFEFVDRAGRRRDIYMSIALIPGTRRSVASLIDITPRKQAEVALQERVKELTCLYAIHRDMQAELSTTELCQRAVDHLVAGMQYPALTVAVIELFGKRCIAGPYSPELSYGLRVPIRRRGESRGYVAVYYTEERPFLPEEQALLAGIGEAFRLWLEHREATQALQEEHDTLERIMDTSPVSIVMVDSEGQIVFANPRAEEVLGLTRSALLQRRYNDPQWRVTTYEGGPFPEKEFPFHQVREKGEAIYDVRHAIELQNGRQVYLSINGAPLQDEQGHLRGAVFTIEDFTQQLRAEEALRRQTERLKGLQAIDRAILAAPSSEMVAREALKHLQHLISFDWGSVTLFDHTHGEMNFIAIEEGLQAQRMQGSEARAWHAYLDLFEELRTGATWLVENEDRLREMTLGQKGEGILLVIPLLSQGNLIGSLNMGGASPATFSSHDMEIVQEVSASLTIALQQIQLLESERSQRQLAEALRYTAQTLGSTLDLDEILDHVLDVLTQVLTYDTASILQIDPEGAFTIVRQRGFDEHSEFLEWVRTQNYHLQDFPDLQRATTEKHAVITRDRRQNEDWVLLPGTDWLCSHICAPLFIEGEVAGFINLSSTKPGFYTAAHAHRLEAFAGQVAAGMHNARLYESVRQQREQLRSLAARLTEAEESERQWLARELHDQIGQNLTALSINLSIIRSQVLLEAPEPLRARLDDSALLLKQMTTRVRRVMEELRPPVLEDYGLLAALRWYGQQFADRTGIEVDVEGEEIANPLVVSAENALFRITQEALTNVAKHAQATCVEINLESNASRVRLTITDNGRGLDTDRLTTPGKQRGWGLVSMRERAEAIGGQCKVRRGPDGGTQVVVEILR